MYFNKNISIFHKNFSIFLQNFFEKDWDMQTLILLYLFKTSRVQSILNFQKITLSYSLVSLLTPLYANFLCCFYHSFIECYTEVVKTVFSRVSLREETSSETPVLGTDARKRVKSLYAFIVLNIPDTDTSISEYFCPGGEVSS